MIGKGRFIIVYILLIIVGLYINLHADVTVPTNKPFSEFPVQNGHWQMTGQTEFSENVLNVLRPTDYIARQYDGSDGSRVGLYIGYHGGGKESAHRWSPHKGSRQARIASNAAQSKLMPCPGRSGAMAKPSCSTSGSAM